MDARTSRIATWLLERAQLDHGPHQGGVVGWLRDGEVAEFAYPEITGYFLTWLAFLDQAGHADARTAACRTAALAWLDREVGRDGGPSTRAYLGTAAATEPDWRNDALFAFDLGMVYRGVAASRPASPAPVPAATARVPAAIASLLAGMRDTDGSLLACRPRAGRQVPPPGWAARPDIHLLKVAGGMLAWPWPDDQDGTLAKTALATLERHAPDLSNRMLPHTHPSLYALEGLLQAELAGYVQFRAELVEGYRRLAGRATGGSLVEELDRPGSRPRSDVIAQLLRLGCVLVGRGDLPAGHRVQLDEMARTLHGYLDPSGGVWFDPGRPPPRQLNTWCAMFTHQALTFHARIGQGRPIPPAWIGLLV